MILPTKDTPPGTPCWVRDYDSQTWEESKFLRADKCAEFNWATQNRVRWKQCRLDDPYAKPVPHVHRDLMIQYANDPSQKVWRQRQDGTWQRMLSVLWRYYEKYHIGEEPPKPEPQMITIEGHTFAAPSKVQTETHTCGLADALWIRRQDLEAYLAAKDALMALAIKEQLK